MLVLKFGQAEDIYCFTREVREYKDGFATWAEQRFTSVEMLTVAMGKLVLRIKAVVHDANFPIDSELIDDYIIFRKIYLQLSHILGDLAKEIAANLALLIEDVFQDYFALLAEPHLEHDQSLRIEAGQEVILNHGGDEGDLRQAELLKGNIIAAFHYFRCVEKSVVVAEDNFPHGSICDGGSQNVAHLWRQAVALIDHLLHLQSYNECGNKAIEGG